MEHPVNDIKSYIQLLRTQVPPPGDSDYFPPDAFSLVKECLIKFLGSGRQNVTTSPEDEDLTVAIGSCISTRKSYPKDYAFSENPEKNSTKVNMCADMLLLDLATIYGVQFDDAVHHALNKLSDNVRNGDITTKPGKNPWPVLARCLNSDITGVVTTKLNERGIALPLTLWQSFNPANNILALEGRELLQRLSWDVHCAGPHGRTLIDELWLLAGKVEEG